MIFAPTEPTILTYPPAPNPILVRNPVSAILDYGDVKPPCNHQH